MSLRIRWHTFRWYLWMCVDICLPDLDIDLSEGYAAYHHSVSTTPHAKPFPGSLRSCWSWSWWSAEMLKCWMWMAWYLWCSWWWYFGCVGFSDMSQTFGLTSSSNHWGYASSPYSSYLGSAAFPNCAIQVGLM